MFNTKVNLSENRASKAFAITIFDELLSELRGCSGTLREDLTLVRVDCFCIMCAHRVLAGTSKLLVVITVINQCPKTRGPRGLPEPNSVKKQVGRTKVREAEALMGEVVCLY